MKDEDQGRYRHSRYRGVAWHSTGHKWRAYCAGRHLGLFGDERVAAIAAYRERQRRGQQCWEDPEIVRAAQAAGPIASTRRWTWNQMRSD